MPWQWRGGKKWEQTAVREFIERVWHILKTGEIQVFCEPPSLSLSLSLSATEQWHAKKRNAAELLSMAVFNGRND